MLSFRPTPRHRVHKRLALALPLMAILSWGGTEQAAAQDPSGRRDPSIADSVFGRFIVISHRSGPPGTEVTLQPMYLPSVTPVQISIGGTRSGFEVLGQMMTDQQGELSEAATFKVPEWAERDRTYMFMVLDLYFKPLAASSPFYVTGPDGTVLRQGRITSEGKSCITLRGEGDELYSLKGRTGQLELGDSVVVEGPIVDSPGCSQGTVIDVVRIQRLNRSPARPSGAAASPGLSLIGALPRADTDRGRVPTRSVDTASPNPVPTARTRPASSEFQTADVMSALHIREARISVRMPATPIHLPTPR